MENAKNFVVVFDYNNVMTYIFETASEVNEELIYSFLRKQLKEPKKDIFEGINWMSKCVPIHETIDTRIKFINDLYEPEPIVHLNGVYKRLFDSRKELNNPMVSMMADFQKIIENLILEGYSFQEINTLNWDQHKDFYNNEKPAYVQLDIMDPTESGMSNHCLSLTIFNKDSINKANLYEPYLVIANDDGDYVSIDLWTPSNAFESQDIIMSQIESAIEHFIKLHYFTDF
jgi:hypothetical protein